MTFSIIWTVRIADVPSARVNVKVKSLLRPFETSRVFAFVYAMRCCRYAANWVCTAGANHSARVNLSSTVSMPDPPV